jgi:WD40 repeat protein
MGNIVCALWDTVDGALLWSGAIESTTLSGAIAFSPRGEAVSLCHSVLRANGTLLRAVSPKLSDWLSPSSLSPDGASGVTSDPGESIVAVVDLESGRMDLLGGPPPSSFGRMTGLAVSADGRTLASLGGAVLAWHLAPQFEESRAQYLFSAGLERPEVEVSPDGRWISASGDGRIVGSTSGEILFPPYGNPPNPCWPLEFRFSPDGKWAAGAGLNQGIEVFRMSAVEGTGRMDLAQNLFADCTVSHIGIPIRFSERVAFTSDGEYLETETGKRYRTSDWQQVSEGSGNPVPHQMLGSLELSSTGDAHSVGLRYRRLPAVQGGVSEVLTGRVLGDCRWSPPRKGRNPRPRRDRSRRNVRSER